MTLKKQKISLGILTLILTFGFSILNEAHALRIIPPRLVLKPDVKIEYMYIKNNSNKTETYRFGWKHMAMDKEGNVLNLDKLGLENAPSGYKPASDIIRFSPRRATLEPGQTQRITFMVNRSKATANSEYRSHFLFQREPEKTEIQEPDQNQIDSNEVKRTNVDFNVLVSRAVPIYVINGETNAKLNFVSAAIEKNDKKTHKDQPDYLANFKVQKIGNRSVIGIAQVLCNSGGEEVVISKPAKVFAVYAEGEFRNERLAVKIPPKGCSSHRLLVKAHPNDIMSGQTLIDQKF